MTKRLPIYPNSIESHHLKDDIIKEQHIQEEAISNSKIAFKTIINRNLADEIITPNKINQDNNFFFKSLDTNQLSAKKIILQDPRDLILHSNELIPNLNSEYLNSKKNSITPDPFSLVERNFMGDIQVKKIISSETLDSPFVISSRKLVNNLNSELLNGRKASNSKDDIPLSNGTLNENLNSEMLNGAKLSNSTKLGIDEKIIPNEKIVKESIERTFKTTEHGKDEDWNKQVDIGVNKVLNGTSLNGPQKHGEFFVINFLHGDGLTQLAIPTNNKFFPGSFIRMRNHNAWTSWSLFSVSSPLTLTHETINNVNEGGHTHQLSKDILNRFSRQEIYGENIFTNISIKQKIFLPHHGTNKEYVDNNINFAKEYLDKKIDFVVDKVVRNKTITGFNIFFNNSIMIIGEGECLDSTLTTKLFLTNSIQRVFQENNFGFESGKSGLFNGIEIKPFTTYHIFILKKEDRFSIGFDIDINASNRPENTLYRRIGSFVTNEYTIEKFKKFDNIYKLDEVKNIYFYEPFNDFIRLFVPQGIIVEPLLITNAKTFSKVTNLNGEMNFDINEGFISISGWKDYLLEG